MAAMIIVSIKQRINLFQPVILGWLLRLLQSSGFVYLISVKWIKLPLKAFPAALAMGYCFLSCVIIVGGVYKSINIFDAFIDGAKGGFETAVRIIPYLVGMLVAISLLRTSGTFDYVIDGMKDFCCHWS